MHLPVLPLKSLAEKVCFYPDSTAFCASADILEVVSRRTKVDVAAEREFASPPQKLQSSGYLYM